MSLASCQSPKEHDITSKSTDMEIEHSGDIVEKTELDARDAAKTERNIAKEKLGKKRK